MDKIKLAVVGSRAFNDYEYLEKEINELGLKILEIISGGAVGTDTLAEKYAKKYNIPTTILKPDWNKWGRSAGILRNKDIINHSDGIIAFWDGKSKGTKNSIDLAKKNNKLLKIILVDQNVV